MTNKEEFDYFVGQLLDHAVHEFQSTGQYTLLKEKLDQMDRDCETMFTKDEQDFAVECFELLSDVSGQQEHYVYRKGLKDCVMVLKWLGVLA